MESKSVRSTCEECYFHRAALCALRLDEACPTFRHESLGPLVEAPVLRMTRRQLADVLRDRRLARSAA